LGLLGSTWKSLTKTKPSLIPEAFGPRGSNKQFLGIAIDDEYLKIALQKSNLRAAGDGMRVALIPFLSLVAPLCGFYGMSHFRDRCLSRRTYCPASGRVLRLALSSQGQGSINGHDGRAKWECYSFVLRRNWSEVSLRRPAAGERLLPGVRWVLCCLRGVREPALRCGPIFDSAIGSHVSFEPNGDCCWRKVPLSGHVSLSSRMTVGRAYLNLLNHEAAEDAEVRRILPFVRASNHAHLSPQRKPVVRLDCHQFPVRVQLHLRHVA
jgi:hypothetical protein